MIYAYYHLQYGVLHRNLLESIQNIYSTKQTKVLSKKISKEPVTVTSLIQIYIYQKHVPNIVLTYIIYKSV